MNREEGPRTRSQQHSSPVFTVKFDPSPTTTFNNLRTRIVPCRLLGPVCPDDSHTRLRIQVGSEPI